MTTERYLKEKQAFVFELDDVIYPAKDYLLQVYYLFAQFMEYTEQMDARAILGTMQEVFNTKGPDLVFNVAAQRFGISEKYRMNFEMLLTGARLPLKLLMFNEVLRFMQDIVLERKQLFIFTDGDPAAQLNKIRQTEWNGLEAYLEVHFSSESAPKPSAEGLLSLIAGRNLKNREVLMIGTAEKDEECARTAGIEFLRADKLLLI